MNEHDPNLIEIAANRLNLQRNYEPKLRELVKTRSKQLNFSKDERNNALKSINALIWKLTAAGIHLERLWENKETVLFRQLLEKTLNGILEPKRFTDEKVAYLTTEFEAFLVQARAFISIAQIHTLDACRLDFGGHLTNEKYKNIVVNASESNNDRLTKVYMYFSENVFGPNNWGSILKSLRDKVVHFDRIRPTLLTTDDGFEEPTVIGLTLERIAQDFENGAYGVLVNVIVPIWDREWIAGNYYHGMWS